MTDPKFLLLVERLHARTKSGDVKWNETIENGVFQADFGGLSLRLRSRRDPDYPDSPDYVLQILNADARLVEEVTNNDLSPLARAEGPHPYTLMGETYAGARRVAMGVDSALDQLLQDLGK